MFTSVAVSAFSVPAIKFEGRDSDYLRQHIVTSKMVANTIKYIKDNKSPGLIGFSTKLLLQFVGQISIPVTTVLQLSLDEGLVPLERKQANTFPIFKKVRETSLRSKDHWN